MADFMSFLANKLRMRPYGALPPPVGTPPPPASPRVPENRAIVGQRLKDAAAKAAAEVQGQSPGLDPFTVVGQKPAMPPDTMMASTSPSAPPSPGGTPSPASVGPGAAPTSVFDELGPEGVEKVLGMGALQEQMATARALRDKESPGGRYVSNGRLYVASSPLEHLVSGVGKFKGAKDVKRIQKEQLEGRKAIVDLLRGTPQFQALASSTEENLPQAGVFNA